MPPDAGTGKISITAPQTYVPGQTYPVTVTHHERRSHSTSLGLSTDGARHGLRRESRRTANINGLTQILNNAGPGSARQYIEHTAAGTFIGQQNSASWTFNWTAPATDVGPVTFYAAGNQANNDGNTSGDYIYRTFVASAPASSTPDFSISVNPFSRNVVPGGNALYTVTITPLAGFTGQVNLSTSPLPAGGAAVFNPAAINITDANSKTSTLSLATDLSTAVNTHSFNINAQSGSTMHLVPAELKVVSPTSADLSLTKTASPNPGQAGVSLSYRIMATNNGPAAATNVTVADTLPAGVTFVSATATQGNCNGSGPVNCNLGGLAVGSSAIVTIIVTPSTAGQIINSATVSASES